jgi:hypothetical protein
MKTIDLTAQEQTNVRTALRFLRSRCGGWKALGKALRFNETTLSDVAGKRTASPTLAYRVARLGGVTVDDVLAGRYPAPGTCPHCGHYEAPSSAVPSASAPPT